MSDPRRVHLAISGLVQGVGFRYALQHEAETLDLTGWVRNCPDGSVECEAQGPTDAVTQLIRWAHEGPRFARVESVAVTEIAAVEENGFSIAR